MQCYSHRHCGQSNNILRIALCTCWWLRKWSPCCNICHGWTAFGLFPDGAGVQPWEDHGPCSALCATSGLIVQWTLSVATAGRWSACYAAPASAWRHVVRAVFLAAAFVIPRLCQRSGRSIRPNPISVFYPSGELPRRHVQPLKFERTLRELEWPRDSCRADGCFVTLGLASLRRNGPSRTGSSFTDKPPRRGMSWYFAPGPAS